MKCGRGSSCVAAKDIEVEIDCNDLDEVAELERLGLQLEGGRHNGAECGYLRQEIEGVGGGVKMKVRKTVRVGKTVVEFEDERERGRFLEREREGGRRSWCGWCERVVLGGKDDMVGAG